MSISLYQVNRVLKSMWPKRIFYGAGVKEHLHHVKTPMLCRSVISCASVLKGWRSINIYLSLYQ